MDCDTFYFFGELKSNSMLGRSCQQSTSIDMKVYVQLTSFIATSWSCFLAVHSLLNVILYCIMLSRAQFVVISYCNVLTSNMGEAQYTRKLDVYHAFIHLSSLTLLLTYQSSTSNMIVEYFLR